ncbi:MAG TPA: LLM class flavin-dependent oxidoreductase [Dehalococcoidia bacterium]|nr:LLM class flavin-dependent oxidoreductase [Dehalococcoidia bacterium]
MRIGVLGAAGRIADLIALAKRVEELGYDSIWVPEFHNSDGFVRMTAVALNTSRLTVASGIVNAFNRAPAMVAAAAMDIDELSDGRLILGIGTSTRRMQERWYGIEYRPPAPRVEELIQLLQALWRGHAAGPFRFQGDYYDVEIETYGRAAPRRETVPIYLAGVNRRMVRAAAHYADGLVGHPLYSQSWIRDAVLPSIEDGLRRSGRTRDQFVFSSEIITSVSNEREEAMRAAKLQVGFYATTRTYETILAHSGWAGIADDLRAAFARRDMAGILAAVPDEMVEATAVVGTPDEAREKMRRYEGTVDLAILYPPGFGLGPEESRRARDAMIETFAPALTRAR